MGTDSTPATAGTVREVLRTYLLLGLTSFGGPIAHLGYFHRELVQRRRWVSEEDYAQLLALCQFLPGPASSQLGFGLGLLRAGWAGAAVAFVAFTLPSALLMFAFGTLLPTFSGAVLVDGLKLVAVAVVAHGVVAMARKLCPDLPRRLIALAAAVVLILASTPWLQLAVVAGGALAGSLWVAIQERPLRSLRPAVGRRLGAVLLLAFALLLAGAILPPGLASDSQDGSDRLEVAAAFYRAGALVFGGGHVVLPLLEESVVAPGWVSADEFLAGYGAAQAVPGPMFTFSAFLGARLPGDLGGLAGAAVALGGIFLPGFLLLSGILPWWRRLLEHPAAGRAIAGVNAAVVGLLAAALYDPVGSQGLGSLADVVIAGVGFALLWSPRLPPWVVVLWCVGARALGAALGLA